MTLCVTPHHHQPNSPKFPAPPIGALSPSLSGTSSVLCHPCRQILKERTTVEDGRKVGTTAIIPQNRAPRPCATHGLLVSPTKSRIGLVSCAFGNLTRPGPQTPLHPLPGFRNFPPRALDCSVILRFEILPIANPSPPLASFLWRRQAVNLADPTFPRRYLRLTRNPRLSYPRQLQQRPAPGPARVPHLPHLLRPSARPSSAIMPFI